MSADRRRVRLPRSAGTANMQDFFRIRKRSRLRAAIPADLEALERGEGRMLVGQFRGSYGSYPRRFRGQMLDLAPDGLVIRPFWSSPFRRRYVVSEPVTGAYARPRDRRTDWNVPATGFSVVRCTTSRGFRKPSRSYSPSFSLRQAGSGVNFGFA